MKEQNNRELDEKVGATFMGASPLNNLCYLRAIYRLLKETEGNNFLELISEKKYMNLTKDQVLEAKALYLHLLNHTEVQEAPTFRGMPCCKICNKSAYQIFAEEGSQKTKPNNPLNKNQRDGQER